MLWVHSWPCTLEILLSVLKQTIWDARDRIYVRYIQYKCLTCLTITLVPESLAFFLCLDFPPIFFSVIHFLYYSHPVINTYFYLFFYHFYRDKCESQVFHSVLLLPQLITLTYLAISNYTE